MGSACRYMTLGAVPVHGGKHLGIECPAKPVKARAVYVVGMGTHVNSRARIVDRYLMVKYLRLVKIGNKLTQELTQEKALLFLHRK